MSGAPAAPLVYGHRGAAAHAPENTVAALRAAVAAGADGVEVDVRLTADDHPVLVHDGWLDRTTDGSGPVRHATAAETARLDAGGWFDPAFAGEPVADLDALLAWARGEGAGVRLNVELKPDPGDAEALVDAVAAPLSAADLADRLVVSSFHHPCLAALAVRAPEISLGALTAWPLHRPADYLAGLGADALHLLTAWVDDAVAAELRAAGMGLRAWTVDDPAELVRIAPLCDAVISDDPGAALTALGRG